MTTVGDFVGPLTVTVHRGTGLKDVELVGHMSPFVELWTQKDTKFKTKVAKHAKSEPVWEDGFIFNLDGKESMLHIRVYDHRTVGHSLIGKADIDLKLLRFGEKTMYDIVHDDDSGNLRGRIEMSVNPVGGSGGSSSSSAPAPTAAPTVIVEEKIVVVESTPSFTAPVFTAPAPAPVASYGSPIGGRFYLSSSHGTQISASDNRASLHASPNRAGWETWELKDAGGGKVLLTSAHGTQLSCTDGGELRQSPNSAGWEQWTVASAGEGRYYITAWTGNNLGMEPSGTLYCKNRNTGSWEQWNLQSAS